MKNQKNHYAVFGNPIAHSKSPILQSAFAEQTHQDIVYTAECIAINEFTPAVDQFFSQGGKGLNITVPFKIEAYNYASKLTSRAQKAGAVNTLWQEDGLIVGDNTDGAGLVFDMVKNLSWQLKGKKILLLGAGGAVRGIIEPLQECLPASITIANRTVEKAIALADTFKDGGETKAYHYDQLDDTFDIVINGTSASLQGELPQLPDNLLAADACCYDMMYQQNDTVFMQWARQQGCQNVSDGLGMLVCQGAESFFQWRGQRPDTSSVIQLLREQF